MLTDSPQVTVVICSYDREETLGPALESVASQQTGGDFVFEIVVVDDASTDGTCEVVRRAAENSHLPLRYVREYGRGVAFARNRGVQEARGDWIAFFDDDQIAEGRWLLELMCAARETRAEIVGGARRLDFSGNASPDLGPLVREVLGEKDYGSRTHRSNRYTLACTGNMLVRRDLFHRIGLFDTDMHSGMEDIDLSRRAFEAGVGSWYTPRAVVRHLIPPQRLREAYLKWTCLRVGANLSLINYKSWGPARMLLPCLLRVVHALTLNPLMTAVARLARKPAMLMDRKCYRWMAVGSARMALRLLLPRVFPQGEFFEVLAFRGERHTFDDGGR